MAKLLKFLSGEKVLVTILLIFFMLLVNTPLALRIRQTPPDKYYTGGEKFYPDYYSILGIMNQGASGAWILKDENGKNTKSYFYHIEYLVMGKIAKALNIENVTFYHFTRELTILLLFITAYKIVSVLSLSKSAKILTLISAFFLATPPVLENFYRLVDNLSLFTQNLHHELGILGSLVSLYLLIIFIKFKKLKYLALLSLALIFTSIVQTAQSVLLGFTLVFSAIILLTPQLLKRDRNSLPILLKRIIIISIIGLSIAVPLIIYKIQFTIDPILKTLGSDVERFYANKDFEAPLLPIIQAFLFYTSPFILLSLPLAKAYKRLSSLQKTVSIISLSYIVSFSALFIFAFYLVGVSRLRFAITTWPFAFAFLIGLASDTLIETVKKVLRFKPALILSLAILIFSIPSWQSSIKKDIYFGDPPKLNEHVYPKKEIIDAIVWMRNLPPFTRVISSFYSGMLFMGYGGVMPYINVPFYQTDFDDRLKMGDKFYEGNMDEKMAKEFLKSNDIKYVFVGPYDQPYYDMPKTFKFLKEVYSNPDVKIYFVNL